MHHREISNFQEQGYALLKNFLDPDMVHAIHRQAKQLFALSITDALTDVDEVDVEDTPRFDQLMFRLFEEDFERFVNTGKHAQHLVELWRLASSKAITQLLTSIGLEFPALSVRPTLFFNSKRLDKTGHYWKLESHQDWRSSQGSIDSVTIWFPYVDCSTSLGALEVIPGSHRCGLLSSSTVDYYAKINDGLTRDCDFLPIEMNVGDLLIFNGFLVHRSGLNQTGRIRWSSQLRYNNLRETSFRRRKMPHTFTYTPWLDLATPGSPTNEEIANFFNGDASRSEEGRTTSE
jgi:phytanoyl-CoA hydroxylase